MMFASIFACFNTQYKALDGSCQYYGNIVNDQMCGYNARFINNYCECKSDYPYTDPIFAGCTACTETDEDQIGMFSGQCQCHNNFAWDSTLTKPTCVADCGGKPFFTTAKNVKVCVQQCKGSNCSCEDKNPLINGKCSCSVQVDGKCSCANYYASNMGCQSQQECKTQFNFQQCSCEGFVYDTVLNQCILAKECELANRLISINQMQCITLKECQTNQGQSAGFNCVCLSNNGFYYDKRNSKIGSQCITLLTCKNITGDSCYLFNNTGKCVSPLHMNMGQTECVSACQENQTVNDDKSRCVCSPGFILNQQSICVRSLCNSSEIVDISGKFCVQTCGSFQVINQSRCVCVSGYSVSIDKQNCYKNQTACLPGYVLSPSKTQCVIQCNYDEYLDANNSACACLSVFDPETNTCQKECSYFRGTSCDYLGSRSCPYFYVDQQLKRTCTQTCPSAVRNQMCVQSVPQNKNGANIGVIIPVIVVPIVIAVVVVFVLFRCRKPVEVKAKTVAEKMKVTVGQPVNSYI
ncbi:EGF-like_domain [Hexamita inflata]|uniref:EGF-like domain n=1 Tax=Hexamita inflata TaxID=28002 RepID=A0AA86TZJ3_9EUKA|nr:EGF-like domain [Hexamita inflata]